jgi:hypothetical protein
MKKLEPKEDVKLADSEVTGNDHMLQVVPGVHVWNDEQADKFLVKTDVDTKIYCKIADRHTDLQLFKGKTYEIGKAQEWDHLSRERRNVRD